MFGTLSYDRDRREPVFEADTTSSRGTTIRKACELCRARKLRCSADPSGCDRCKASSSECKYPPRRFREGRKRGLASRTSAGTKNHELLAADSATSSHTDVSGRGDFNQLDWQNDSGSAEVKDDIQPLSTHNLLEANHGLGPHSKNTFPGDSPFLSRSTEYSFSDLLEASRQDNHTETPTSLGSLPGLSLQSYKDLGKGITPLGASDSDSDPAYLKLSDLPGVGMPVGCEWSQTIFDMTPEVFSSPSLYSNNSVEAVITYAGRDETKLHSDSNYCQCLGLVARLLAQVETQGTKSDTSIDGLLEACREPLREYKTLLSCPHCKSRPDSILLLAMLAKSLSVVYNGLVQRYVKGRLEGGHEQLVLANQWPEVRVGAYFVEDSAERSMVISALIVTRLNNLHDVLIDLKARAKRREGHLAILLQVEERVKDLKALMPMSNSLRQILDVN